MKRLKIWLRNIFVCLALTVLAVVVLCWDIFWITFNYYF